MPETGSTRFAVTARVVAGSKMVPTGIERFNASFRGVPLNQSWYRGSEHLPLPCTQSLVIAEKEKLVATIKYMGDHNRAAGRHAELILTQNAFRSLTLCPGACFLKVVGCI